MPVTVRLYRKIKNMVKKILFRIKLRKMDEEWRLSGRSCWSLFPPSFYYTHTEEEIERITAETADRIQKLIDQL